MTVPIYKARNILNSFGSSLKVVGSIGQFASLPVGGGLPVFSSVPYSICGFFYSGNLTNAGSNSALYSEASSTSTSPLFYLGLKIGRISNFVVLVRNDSNIAQLNTIPSTTVIQPGQWYSYAWVDNGGGASLYINNVIDSAVFNYTPTGTYTFDTASIGAVNRSGGIVLPATAFISRTGIYNRAITTNEIDVMHRTGVMPSDARGLYYLNEGSGTTAVDSSGHANNGTLQGAPSYATDSPFRGLRQTVSRSTATGRPTV